MAMKKGTTEGRLIVITRFNSDELLGSAMLEGSIRDT